MRPQKALAYQSVFDALHEEGCSLCRYLKNYQQKLLQGRMDPLPVGLCNFHAWAIAATQDKDDAIRIFMRAISGNVINPTVDCDLCIALGDEELRQLKLLASLPKSWGERDVLFCMGHSARLRRFVSPTERSLIDKALAKQRDDLIETLRANLGPNPGGAGVLGHAAEFLAGQRGLKI